MVCDEVRLALSAQLDGEATGLGPGSVEEHLAQCPGCRAWRDGAAALAGTPELTVLATAPVPDRTVQIMAAVTSDRAAAHRPGPAVGSGAGLGARVADQAAEAHARQQILRLAVAAAAVVQLALAIPALVSAFIGPGAGVGLHASREMASFDVAVAVGFLLAAVRPGRARTFLPVAVVLAGCLALTSGIDLARGATTLTHEIGHLVALAQAGLLWALTRSASHSPEPDAGSTAVTA